MNWEGKWWPHHMNVIHNTNTQTNVYNPQHRTLCVVTLSWGQPTPTFLWMCALLCYIIFGWNYLSFSIKQYFFYMKTKKTSPNNIFQDRHLDEQNEQILNPYSFWCFVLKFKFVFPCWGTLKAFYLGCFQGTSFI